MKIKDIYRQVALIKIDAEVTPHSFMSESYHKSIVLHPEDEMRICLPCPNGTCTERVKVIDADRLRAAIDSALQGDGTFEIETRCEGWEDEERERDGNYHCDSKFILRGYVLSV